MTLAAREALSALPGADGDVFLLCDGDLGDSAERLGPLAGCRRARAARISPWPSSRARVGGGFGLALGFAALGDPAALRAAHAGADLRAAGAAAGDARGDCCRSRRDTGWRWG